jgi:hypothetical protein
MQVKKIGILALACLLGPPGAALASRSGRRSHHRRTTASQARAASGEAARPVRSDVVLTYEPFGPPAPAALRMPAEAVISGVSVEEVPAAPNCPAQDILAEACDESVEGDSGVPARVASPRRGHLANLVAAVERFGDLFRAKSSKTEVSPRDVNLNQLLTMNLEIPVRGVTPDELRDSFLEARGSRRRHRQHLAIDIGAPRGTPVVAATDGEIVRVRRERRGGNAVYLKDSSGRYLFYYCHLSRYARGLRPGEKVKRGQVLGYVGATGNARGTHLHFSVTRLPEDGPDLRRGLAINPYLVFLFAVQP